MLSLALAVSLTDFQHRFQSAPAYRFHGFGVEFGIVFVVLGSTETSYNGTGIERENSSGPPILDTNSCKISCAFPAPLPYLLLLVYFGRAR